MNGGLINTNFIVGMLVAKDLPRQDQLFAGLSAGQMGPGSAVGIVGLKQIVDKRTESETRATKAEADLAALRSKAGDAGDKRVFVMPRGRKEGAVFERHVGDERSNDLDKQKQYFNEGGAEHRKGFFWREKKQAIVERRQKKRGAA